MKYKVGAVSLGCDKNRVDTENMLAYFAEDGYEITPDPAQADVIVVNTCGFIDPAKQESIDTVLEMARYKQDKCKVLAVTGCLSQRYGQDLTQGIPEIDVLAGTDCYHKLPATVDRILAEGGKAVLENAIDDRHFTSGRVLSTPWHYAYLKIAEGCSNHCTYCAIPRIRGKYTSRPMPDLVNEAQSLVRDYGVRELIIVAQDITRYGTDLYGKSMLIELLEELSKTDVKWIRLLYLYPELLTPELISYIANNDKICKYVDIPLQHISDTILKKMGRRVDSRYIEGLIDSLHRAGIYIRSTFIVGFPGESEEDFALLKDFLVRAKLDACGFFAYSREEGTPAAKMKDQISARVKKARLREAYALQQQISAACKAQFKGRRLSVVYEDIDYDRQMFVGRTQFQTPDVDGVTYFTSDTPVEAGNVYEVLITGSDGDNLIGVVESNG